VAVNDFLFCSGVPMQNRLLFTLRNHPDGRGHLFVITYAKSGHHHLTALYLVKTSTRFEKLPNCRSAYISAKLFGFVTSAMLSSWGTKNASQQGARFARETRKNIDGRLFTSDDKLTINNTPVVPSCAPI
jgi:hypothetical protein